LPTAIVGEPYRLNSFDATQRHAAIAVAFGRACIPTVSAWDLVVMTLLMLTAGIIAILRPCT